MNTQEEIHTGDLVKFDGEKYYFKSNGITGFLFKSKDFTTDKPVLEVFRSSLHKLENNNQTLNAKPQHSLAELYQLDVGFTVPGVSQPPLDPAYNWES